MTKDNKDARIEIRTTVKDKHKIEKLASKNEMTVSQYLIYCALNKSSKKTDNMQFLVRATAIVQEVSNYLEENYNDKSVKGLSEELWGLL